MTDMQELVVPKSIPRILDISTTYIAMAMPEKQNFCIHLSKREMHLFTPQEINNN